MNKKILIISTGLALIIVLFLILFKEKEVTFGVIADCQYCDDPGQGVRKYSASKDKLTKCVEHLNTLDLDFVIHLGDFIDRDIESFDVVIPIYERLIAPGYHVLGNHDFSVRDEKKNNIPELMGLSSRYFDFEVKGWRFVVLDGNDISFHAYPAGSDQYKNAVRYYEAHNIESPKWNGAIGEEQLEWLKGVLENAAEKDENVILFCHFPVYPDNPHNLWNATEIIDLVEDYPGVKAYLNGHNHAGNYGSKERIHYVTIKGMVDTEETSYTVIRTQRDRIEIAGFGREENMVLEIRK